MKDPSFYNTRSERCDLKTRQIVDELPRFAAEFFVGVAQRTSSLTRLNYAHDLRIFFDFLSKVVFKGKVALDEITLNDMQKLQAFDIERYLEYLSAYTFRNVKSNCNDRAKERKLCSVRSFFKYFYHKEKLLENITAKVSLPKIHSKPIVRLEVDEVVKLLDGVSDTTNKPNKQLAYLEITQKRDMAILTILLGTGMRISECIGLNKSDVDFNLNALSVTRKGGSKSILYFGDEVRDALQEYLGWLRVQQEEQTKFGKNIKDFNALFLSCQGKRISLRALQNMVEKYAKQTSPLKRISPHKLRSTYGTNLYRETGDIYVVADVLGHRDVNTTKKHYADMSDEVRRGAARKVRLREKR